MSNKKQKAETSKEAAIVGNNVLAAGYSFQIGDFQIYLDEDSKELKVIVHKNKLRMTIKPNSDNSCTVVACR